jgi:hypothetical protein
VSERSVGLQVRPGKHRRRDSFALFARMTAGDDFGQVRELDASLDFIQRAAEALDVSVAELLGSESKAARGKPGPTPQLQLRFDQIRRLPRKEQEFVLRFIDTVLEKAQKA